MRQRVLALAFWSCLLSAVCGLLSCDWKPVARPVQPELMLEGPVRVEILLDVRSRFVLISREGEDESGNPRRVYSIAEWKVGNSCDLPEGTVRFVRPLSPRTSGTTSGMPLFLLPIAVQQGDVQQLQFVDEECQVRGETDYGTVSNTMNSVPLDDDGREVLLYGNGDGTLAIADPWNDERTVIADDVRKFAFVLRASAYSAPQLLWLIEGDTLTQRGLDGTLVLSLGKSVTSFVQTLFGELRVAYVDGGDLYEAVGPDLGPSLVAEGACNPVYHGSSLDLFNPCADSQLVRINLQTGDVEEFDEGVFDAYTDSGFHFERTHDAEGQTHQWVQPPGLERQEISPPFLGRPIVVDAQTLAGLKNLENGRTFVVWSASGPEQVLYSGITDFFVFNDNRTSSYLWLVQHDVTDTPGAEGNKLGKLSLFGQRDLTLQTFGEGIPLRNPLGDTPTGVHGYSVEILAPFTEPLVVLIENAQPLESNPRLSRGTLSARLLSGELGSTIAHDVTSYEMISAPLPGVLYGVEEGEQPGLWFATL